MLPYVNFVSPHESVGLGLGSIFCVVYSFLTFFTPIWAIGHQHLFLSWTVYSVSRCSPAVWPDCVIDLQEELPVSPGISLSSPEMLLMFSCTELGIWPYAQPSSFLIGAWHQPWQSYMIYYLVIKLCLFWYMRESHLLEITFKIKFKIISHLA